MLTQKEQDLLGRIFISKNSLSDPEKLMFWKIIGFMTDDDGQRKAIVRGDSKIKRFTLETDCYNINEEDLEKNAMFVDNIVRGIWRGCQGF